ncbi:DUF3500 domain-containing protein [Rubinisphaera sp.]|uniref:DUF3500 domain-containing protein n=1 Tax=Rubinisphaera sp. TaxID=2024857 RepID=UPI000C12206A|nr:DUF3500 domain-containing protein [Rubinisphaera sp.]MBV08507.1 hypothetical protein [Rubinisphaera sp.]|tara:strand:+ start:3892 stop:4944 length:1053 start_codon:yes stop_codon:yes gene_type:complete
MKKTSPALILLSATLLLSTLFVANGWSVLKKTEPSPDMTAQATGLLNQLDERQLEVAMLPYASSQRVDWHFIPMETRKGLMLRHMTDAQRENALGLLKTCLSQAGYKKAESIMSLEKLLYSFEKPETRDRRDPLKYYVTIFGDPREDKQWGLSFEGHHLSLNFVVENGELIAATPQFFATNPATIKTENDLGFKMGMAVLKDEEQLGFDLVNSLSDSQKKSAIIDQEAPREIRNAGSVHPPTDAPAGIPAEKLSNEQKVTLKNLINVYANAVPQKRAAIRLKEIEDNGFENVHFAWAGATEPGIGHYYRIQAKSFLIEFVNTQPDAAGNPANHIHCVWRDMDGDFALPIQ